MNQNRRIILFGILLTFSFIFLPSIKGNLTVEAFTIIQDPSESSIVINDSINVTVINNQAEPINSIFLFYCSLEPEFVCHFPSLEMEKNNQGHFFTVFVPEYEVNTTLGYHLQVNMESGSTHEIPDSLNYPTDSNIRQGSDDIYYFELWLVESLTSENNAPWLSIECIFALTLFIRKKKKIRKKALLNH